MLALRLSRTLGVFPPLLPLNCIIPKDIVWVDILVQEVGGVMLGLQVQLMVIL